MLEVMSTLEAVCICAAVGGIDAEAVDQTAELLPIKQIKKRGAKMGVRHRKLVPIQKWLICPISALREKFNPRNINHMPPVKFFVRLDLEQIILFLDGH
jgi:hypothetical protein